MAGSKPTPEEKLFSIIQGANASPIRRRSGASLGQVGARVAALAVSMDMPRVNQLLLAMAVALGFLCLTTPLVMRPQVDRLLAREPVSVKPFSTPPLEGLRAPAAYLEPLLQADPFRIGPEAHPPATASAPRVDPASQLGELKLVGIAWGVEPVAMIEQSRQTYFLKRGEPIGPAIVKEILQDRVILTVGDRDVELF